jgi:hypothetical protein
MKECCCKYSYDEVFNLPPDNSRSISIGVFQIMQNEDDREEQKNEEVTSYRLDIIDFELMK